MPKAKITLSGAKSFRRKLNNISKGVDKIDVAVKRGAKLIEGEAKRNISRGARSGNVYQSGKKGIHIASAQGEFPKTDTGELVSNITIEKVKRGVYTVGSRAQAPHGYYLETKSPQYGGRPWLRPTIKANADRFFKIIDDTYKKLIRDS